MALGSCIRKQRERLGWTLENLSERCGVDVGTISALEVRNSKRSQYAQAIAQALGMSMEQLLDTGGEVSPPVQHAVSEIDQALLADLAVLLPEDADVWRAKIRAAATKVRRSKVTGQRP